MKTPYTKGLHEVGDGVWAWLQPDGSWGWSNAGLVTDPSSDASMLVDTLFDLKLTAQMLDAMRSAVPAAATIGTLVNTHANGDHTYGNALLSGARIVASRRCLEEMNEVPPQLLAGMMQAAPGLGSTGEYLQRIFGAFEFEGIELTLPTDPFDDELTVTIGDRRVLLHEVGPAHTRGDVIVEVPEQRIVFTGDICFIGAHPVMWAGPVAAWIAALDRILAMDVDTVVPGHGPVSGKSEVSDLKAYFEYLTEQTRLRFEAGMAPLDAARDIDLGAFDGWTEAERMAVNVTTIYRELGADVPADAVTMFSQMAELAS